MAQHKASNTRTLRSALRHKKAADAWLDDGINAIQGEGAVKVKMNADTDGTWDVDYVATHGTVIFDTDTTLIGQYQRTLRQILVSALSHRKLANEICDLLEDVSVSFNGVLAQMDADAGTLSADSVYEAFRVTDSITEVSKLGGQHKATSLRSLESALSHAPLAKKLIADMAEIQTLVNDMIDIVQSKNA